MAKIKQEPVIVNIDEDKINKIINAKPKNERIAFTRKLKKMQELITSLEPIEEKITDIIYNEKYPIMDEIQKLRLTMIKECVHPKEHLIYFEAVENDDAYIQCKFCNARLMVN